MEGSILECEPNKSAPGALKGNPRAEPKAKRRWPIASLTVAAGAAFTVLAVTGIMSRAVSVASLQQETNRSAELSVAVVTPRKAPATVAIDLPGQTQAYTQAPIFSQTTPYLETWYFDIGFQMNSRDLP